MVIGTHQTQLTPNSVLGVLNYLVKRQHPLDSRLVLPALDQRQCQAHLFPRRAARTLNPQASADQQPRGDRHTGGRHIAQYHRAPSERHAAQFLSGVEQSRK